jgi:hypothetical protein
MTRAEKLMEMVKELYPLEGDRIVLLTFTEENGFMSGEILSNFCCRKHMTLEIVGLLAELQLEAAGMPQGKEHFN